MSENHDYATKTEDGKQFPPGDYAYVPDPGTPSTWKLRLTSEPGGKPDPAIVGAAAAALGAGFRGQKVEIPSGDRPAVVARVRNAWKQANPDKSADEMPASLHVDDSGSRDYETLHDLNNVEIFRVGTWNGDKYTESDLDEIVNAFPDVGYKPPVKLGHKESSGAPAYGYVKSLRRVGDKLVADFMDLPSKVFEAIKNRRFDSVSSEIFFNLKRGGQTFKRALKAVALLGAEIPAVAALKPLRESFNGATAVAHCYTLSNEVIDMDLNSLQSDLKAANEKIAELTAKIDKGDGTATELKALKEQVAERDKKLNQITEERRQEKIDAEVKACRVPAYRPFLKVFLDLATSTETREYAIKDDKGEDKKITAAQAARDLLARINSDASKLFKEIAAGEVFGMPDAPAEKNVSKEVDQRVEKYMAENKSDDYRAAMQAVLLADPELAKRYAQN